MSEEKYVVRADTDFKAEQQKTEETPVMSANFILRGMYVTMDLLYGAAPTLPKFKVIELLARPPYWAWERGGYVRVTRLYSRRPQFSDPEEAKLALRHIDLGRDSQDNEQWHLRIIHDIMEKQGIKQDFVRGILLPRLMVLSYILLAEIIYRLNPAWSFSMNARFESHAEHEYMKLVQAHPEWEEQPIDCELVAPESETLTLADLFRQIGLDERHHKQESIDEYERLTGRPLV